MMSCLVAALQCIHFFLVNIFLTPSRTSKPYLPFFLFNFLLYLLLLLFPSCGRYGLGWLVALRGRDRQMWGLAWFGLVWLGWQLTLGVRACSSLFCHVLARRNVA